MFADLLHFQSLACTDAVAYTADPDYSKIDGNGNVFCAYSKSTVTNKDRSAKDAEWPDYAATSTVTVSTPEQVQTRFFIDVFK
jgi:hypothetical protein